MRRAGAVLAIRIFIVGILAALLSFQAVRTAAVDDRATRGTIGAKLWPSHPAVVLDQTMAEVGRRARRGETLPPSIFHRVEEIAAKTPLAPEPFLIRGAWAQAEGREGQAVRLFTDARTRDPRSDAARYFLTDYYVRTGQTAQALVEMAVFARLAPPGSVDFAPALAALAKSPGAVPHLRSLFRSAPEFEPLVLAQLATNAGNADLILALARPVNGSRNPAPAWQERIVNELVEKGDFQKAYSVWKTISGVRESGAGLFNPTFEQLDAPPPFNWSFASAGGIVEPADARLRVIYYGREDTVLARQLLLLPPGRYRLAMAVSGQSAGRSAIGWSMVCLSQAKTILSLPLKPESGVLTGSFSVPEDCRAQRLELTGSAGEFPQSIDFGISNLRLRKAADS